MRRNEKQINDRIEIDGIIHASEVCRLAMARDNEPYLVPLSFGYDGQAIYFHTAGTGKKIDFLQVNPRVCFEFEQHVKLIPDDDKACKWTFSFKSVIGRGIVDELIDPVEKKQALAHIMRHYSQEKWVYNEKAVAKTRVWKITVHSLSGKQSPKVDA